jgi:trehalose/maltose hydrolase-like predicted phosphorylase
VFTEERHIVSCVARGQWLASVASGDDEYRHGPAWAVIRACAEYWVSRIVVDEDGSAHIRQVCGPDEDAGVVDDNAMTNASAAWTLRRADLMAQGLGEPRDERWATLADALVIPWDPTRGIPLQMAGWNDDRIIKQADATLLIHPWQYPLDEETKARTVDYYRAHYPANQIMMGVAIDAVVDCHLGRPESAWHSLGQLMPHLHEPYLWVTEAPDNENGCFLTGIGGLLQLVMQGFAGVSITDSEEMEITPCLPQAITRLTVHGLCHVGQSHTLTIRRDGEKLTTHCVPETAGRASER